MSSVGARAHEVQELALLSVTAEAEVLHQPGEPARQNLLANLRQWLDLVRQFACGETRSTFPSAARVSNVGE